MGMVVVRRVCKDVDEVSIPMEVLAEVIHGNKWGQSRGVAVVLLIAGRKKTHEQSMKFRKCG